MGKYFTDNYSLLHLASGITAYYWNVSLKKWIIMHVMFELLENTDYGMKFITAFFPNTWPGGKTHKDTMRNSIGDVIYGIIGWLLAYRVNYYYRIGNDIQR